MSTPDLHARAARFFVVAEQISRLGAPFNKLFWEMSASSSVETLTHLPAMAAAVRETGIIDIDTLSKLSSHPLPDVLSPEAVPWYDSLVEAWEVHRGSRNSEEYVTSLLALVRLDGCGMPDGMQRTSRLPEWLEEARRMVVESMGDRTVARTRLRMGDLEALAALADWRPARGVITPPETLREWVTFWQEMYRQRMHRFEDPLLKGIAAKALLNLPEADLRAASIQPYGRVLNPSLLLHDLARAIPAAAQRSSGNYYLRLLDWQPGENNPLPVAGVVEVAKNWLEAASHDHWRCGQMSWQELIRWDRAGNLASCGINLLPFLAKTAETEKNQFVLWKMAQWAPRAGKPEDPSFLQHLEMVWRLRRQSMVWNERLSGWLGGIRLHQAGLASEPPDCFQEAYLSAVVNEDDKCVLLVLAQWSPDAEAPAGFHQSWQQGWQQRLGHEYEIQQVAELALLRQALEQGDGEALRRVTLEVEPGHLLENAFSRFHEVRAKLEAGRVPGFEEAEPTPPAEKQQWKIENEKLKMENHEVTLAPMNRPMPDGLSR